MFQPGQEVLVYKPYQDSNGPNPKMLLPWRGPHICRPLTITTRGVQSTTYERHPRSVRTPRPYTWPTQSRIINNGKLRKHLNSRNSRI